MKESNKRKPTLLNPPLQIFTASAIATEKPQGVQGFARPQLQRLVRPEGVARYFSRRGFSYRSPLD